MESKNEWPKLAGVYKIVCNVNNKVYIGKSINLKQRIKDHTYSENKKKLRGRLQNAIRKYGWDSFDVEILYTKENFNPDMDNDHLLLIESDYIKLYNSTDPAFGYNMCEYSNDFAGKRHTIESKLNMSKGRIGMKLSNSHRLNIGNAHRGKKLSEDTKLKMSKAQCEKNQNEETKLNRIKCRLGKKHSKESLEKMRMVKSKEFMSDEAYQKMCQSRRKENLSLETLEKKRQAQKGKKLSEEQKEKMRNAKLGKKLSEETKLQGRLTRAKNKLLKLQMKELNSFTQDG